MKYKNAPNYVDNPTKYYTSGDTYSDFESITCYSSEDLVNWTFEGDVVTEKDVSYREEMEGVKASWVGRLGVAKVGDTYVMLVQHECDDPDNSLDAVSGYKGTSVTDNWSKQVLVLTSDSPTGKFEWNQRINMIPYTENGTSNTGDQTVFTDPDTGKSYLVYSYGVGRGTIWLSEIVDMGDGLYGPSLEKNYKIYKGAGREGDCMFEYNGDYYLCASDLYGWNASHAYYLRLDSLDEDYLRNWEVSSSMEVMPGCSDDYCHVTQTGFFYTVDGTEQDTVIFCGDRWAVFAGNGLGFNQWCPLSFDENGNPYFNSLSSWYLNHKTGEWAVAEDNNYAKNGSFDADRISVTELTGWTNTVRKGNSPIKNSGNTTTGKYGLALTDSVDFDCTISQEIASNDYVSLPDGSYTMTAQVKNSGDFENLALYVKNNGLKAQVSVDTANSEWTTVTLENVAVSGGKAEIGIDAAGAAGAYCYVDDITFVRTGDVSENAGNLSGTISSGVEGQTLIIEAVQTDGSAKYTYEMEMTGEEQTFVLSSVPAGTYEVKASAYGCRISPETAEAVVPAGETADDISFAVESRMGNLQGIVKDNKGNPVADVTVVLSDGSQRFETSTGSDGSYAFDNIAEGSYTLSFEKTGYASVSETAVAVETGKNLTVDDQVLEMNTGAIYGRVYDAAGNPASGAVVVLRGSESVGDETRLTTTTDEKGDYTFTDVVAGAYTLSAYLGDLNDGISAFAQNVTVVSDQETGVNLDIPEEVAITNGGFEEGTTNGWSSTGSSGRASNDKKHGHVYSGNYGYTVWKEDPFTVDLSQTVTGLENGTYVVNVMAAAGTFTDADELYLYAGNAEGKEISRENIPVTVNGGWEMIGLTAEVTDGTLVIGLKGDLTGGAWANFDDFRLGKIGEIHEAADKGIISGTVCDADGNPEANASVAVRGTSSVYDEYRASVTADENGVYLLKDVPEGTYTVSASAGAWDASVNGIAQNVKVEKQGETQLDLVIPDEVTIVNGGFENGDTTGWSSTGSSGKASNDKGHGHVYQGNYGYTTWKTSDFTIGLEQTVSGISNGVYAVNVTVTGGTYGDSDELYLYAKNQNGDIIAQENIPCTGKNVWELVGLTAEVTDGALTFGVSGNMSANAWVNFDDFRVGQVSTAPVNKEALNALIAEVEIFDTTAYTEASVSEYNAVVEEALAAAKAVQADEKASQSDADSAEAALSTAFQTGKEKLVTIESKLAEGIADSIATVNGQDAYTAESWAAYEAKLAEVRALLESETLTEAQADAAVEELQAAVAGLQNAGSKTDLADLIAEVENLDTSAYTDESAAEYEAAIADALAAAKEIMNGPAVAQDVIDAAVSKLQESFDAAKSMLKVSDTDPEEPGTPQQPSDPAGDNGNDGGAQTPGTGAGTGQNQSPDQSAAETAGSSATPAKAVNTADNFPAAVCAAGAAAAAAACIVLFRRKRER